MEGEFVSYIFAGILASAFSCAGSYALFRKLWIRRIEVLEHDLQAFSEAMYQMAEVQMKTYQKVAGNIGEIEERLLDLAVPSEDPSLPVERRRRVVALAAQGNSMDEIARRASVPRGEAELILSLHRCRESALAQAPKKNGELKQYAQA
jgi:hypothetical protein